MPAYCAYTQYVWERLYLSRTGKQCRFVVPTNVELASPFTALSLSLSLIPSQSAHTGILNDGCHASLFGRSCVQDGWAVGGAATASAAVSVPLWRRPHDGEYAGLRVRTPEPRRHQFWTNTPRGTSGPSARAPRLDSVCLSVPPCVWALNAERVRVCVRAEKPAPMAAAVLANSNSVANIVP